MKGQMIFLIGISFRFRLIVNLNIQFFKKILVQLFLSQKVEPQK